MQLKSLPLHERPRERLIRYGVDALSSIELLAILLGSGTKTRSVLDLSADLLAHFSSLEALSRATLAELQEVKGIGIAKAIQLKAAFALISKKEESEPPLIDSPDALYALVRPLLEGQSVEMLVLVLRDIKQRLIHREILSKGTLTNLLLHPREVFHAAIHHRAHSLLIAHNHPSGDPTPSSLDYQMTRQLEEVGKLVGIPLIDHLIVGKNRYVSLAKQGFLKREY